MGKSNMDISALTPEAQRAVEALVVGVVETEAEMGDISPPRKGAFLSHMAAKETFATIDNHDLARSTEHLVQASAVSLLVASLTL